MTVVSSTWLAWTEKRLDKIARNHDMGDLDLVWIHWGSETVSLPGNSQRRMRDKLDSIVRNQVRNRIEIVAEAQANHWPDLRHGLPVTSVFSCGLKQSFCVHYTCLSSSKVT